ncbi:hypothetical protein MBOL_30300 [Mycobacteroides abscessus subsp. bolletii BD]|nr:hypothetical protein MBOL_30300 [Mycobacteroides abscessus subsp. bolletii BD]
MATLQQADDRPLIDPLAGPDHWGNRLIGGAQAAVMLDRHEWSAGEHSREDHHTGPRGDYCLIGATGQIDAAVSPVPALLRIVELPYHRRPGT